MDLLDLCDKLKLLCDSMSDTLFLSDMIGTEFFEKFSPDNREELCSAAQAYTRYASLFRILDDRIYEAAGLIDEIYPALKELLH